MDKSDHYRPPLALTVLSSIFLLLGAISCLTIVADIIRRRGWKSMMGVMVLAYPINALYIMPVTLYIYFRFGRPSSSRSETMTSAAKHCGHGKTSHVDSEPPAAEIPEADASSSCHKTKASTGDEANSEKADHHAARPTVADEHHAVCSSSKSDVEKGQDEARAHCHHHAAAAEHRTADLSSDSDIEQGQDDPQAHCHHHAAAAERPMWATILVGVSHCGAGCVLGDVVGEWLVYGTGVNINGASIWPELLIDYAFALLFGIAFQYFSIAPMSGQWGIATVWRAAKADILSLTSFEVGAFAWMIIYQVAIFDYKLSILTWTYWWMMQIGMAMGFATAIPMNYFLLKYGIKEACC